MLSRAFFCFFIFSTCAVTQGADLLTIGGRRVLVENGADATATDVKLVIAFHGLGSSPDEMLNHTGLAKKSKELKFILAAPQGRGKLAKGWAAGTCCIEDSDKDTDIQFVTSVIEALKEKHKNIDLNSIYFVGFSNGAILVHRLAFQLSRQVQFNGASHPIRIRGLATLAGTLGISGADLGPHNDPIPLIHFHGTKDKVINPSSNSVVGGFSVTKLDATLDIWRKRNNADVTVRQSPIDDDAGDGTSVTVVQSKPMPSANGAPVTYVEIKNGGHTWPGHAPPPLFSELFSDKIGIYTKEIKAEDMICDFFKL